MVNRLTASVLGCGVLLLLISGCTSMPQRLEVSATPIEKPQLVLPKADQVNMREVKWIVVTPDNWEAAIVELKKTGRPIVIFGLTDQGYENLGLNFSDIRALVQQQQTIIDAYKKYYTESNKSFDKAEQSIKETNEKADLAAGIRKQNENVLDKINPFK